MITCAKHFHKNLLLFYPVWQDKIHVELGQAGIFRRFHRRKNFYDETKWHHNFSHFSKARKAPRVARHPSKFGIHLKSGFRATAFKGIFTTCGDYPLTTPSTLPSFLPPLILIKSSLIHKSFVRYILELYILSYDLRKDYLKKGKFKNIDVKEQKFRTHALAPHIAVFDPSLTSWLPSSC